ncbi:methyltransferase domain-containing protein [Cryptosporangium arvum]|uniref:Ribosomal protein L11 methylase n=1 Tax=Cryptosporangium arvum DSM 44712 TaxID=927661 RepID=A0A010ZSA2_9ACTN|nr:methyltransferase domain-containing protein [Cryptosporangium arvum]EXG81559.1 ribosomal protein L11 methylase [Cryptosporangium arvum DSM 44712]
MTSAARLYGEGITALEAGRPHRLLIRHERGGLAPLALDDWHRPARPGDRSLLARCAGSTLDAGCGPGRLAAALALAGRPVLAVDIVPAAVAAARRRGAAALRRSVFGRVPGAGRWTSVLLADGNIGIGGDPVRLLRRVAALMGAAGRVVVELAPPGAGRRYRFRLEHDRRYSEWVPWADLGADEVHRVGAAAGLVVDEEWVTAGRWFATLVRR